MKTLLQFSAWMLGSLLLLTGCDTGPMVNAMDDFGPIIKIETINTSGMVSLQDMVSNELITGPVTVTFSGPDADAMVDMYSDPISQKTIENGFMNYYISNDVEPTPEEPVRVTLNINKEGYLPVSKAITITEVGNTGFRVRLADKNNLPSGIISESKAETTADAQTGETAEPINILATDSGNDGSRADSTQLQIAAGSILTDADGNALTGQLTSSTTNYKPSDPQAQSYVSSINEELSTEETLANIVGLTEVEITDASGRRATSLQAGSSAKQRAFGGDQLQSLQCGAGETLLTKEVDAGLLRHYDEFYVVIDGAGSVRDFDEQEYIQGTGMFDYGKYRYSLCVEAVPEKYALVSYFHHSHNFITLNITKNGNKVSSTEWNISSYGYSQDYSGVYSYSIYRDEPVVTTDHTYVPYGTSDQPVTYDITFKLPHETYKTTIDYGPTREFDITLPAPPPNIIDATVNVSLQCRNSGEKIPTTEANFGIGYRKAGNRGGDWNFATDINTNYNSEERSLTGGSFNVAEVEQGATYEVKILADGIDASEEIVINGTNVQHTVVTDSDFCE